MFFLLPQLLPDLPSTPVPLPIHPTSCSFWISNKKTNENQNKQNNKKNEKKNTENIHRVNFVLA